MHCRDIGSAGFSCGLKKQGLFGLIIAAAIFSVAEAYEVGPSASLGPEGSISNFSGVIAGLFALDPDPGAHVTLDGTDLSWSGAYHFQTFDLDEVYAVDPELWRYQPFGLLDLWTASFSVRNGGQLTAVNAYSSRDKLLSVDGSGSVFNVLSKFEFYSDTATIAISNGGVMNCGSINIRSQGVKIEVDGAESMLNVHAILKMNDRQSELLISNGGTVTCDSLIGSYITIAGADSCLKVSSEYRQGRSNLEVTRPPGIQVRDGGSFFAGSNLLLESSIVLDVSDGGYAQIGGDPTLPFLSDSVRVANGGELNIFGRVVGHLLVEDGGKIYQWDSPDPDEVVVSVTPDQQNGKVIDVSSAEIKPGGRMVVQANQSCLESAANSSVSIRNNVIYDPFRSTSPWLRVQNHAALHGTIEVKLTGDTLPQPEQRLRLVESLGTMDTTDLKIEAAPWLQCSPVVTDEGLSASFQLVGDGTGGQHIGVSSHLSGVIATDIDDVSVVTAGIGQISWSNGCHLVVDPEEQPGKLFVGYRGDATLSITGRTIENRSAYVGTHTKGSGKVFIEGPGAKWSFHDSNPQTDDSLWEEQSELVIGNRGGYGEIAVCDGASLEIVDGSIKLGGASVYADYSPPSVGSTGILVSVVPYSTSGRLMVSGPGSTVDAANINFGSYGHSELRIEDGGNVTCRSISASYSINFWQSDAAKLTVDGIGSVLECEADFSISDRQDFSIEITNGGRIFTENTIYSMENIFVLPLRRSSQSIRLASDSFGVFSSGEKNIVIDGTDSAWVNAGNFSLGNYADMIIRNDGQMVTGSFEMYGSRVKIETSARVLVAENITTRNGNIDLHGGGGAIHVGTNATGVIPDGTIVVGDGGELDGDATVNGALVVESGGIVTCRRDRDYFLNPDVTLNVDSIDLQPGGTLRIIEYKTGPNHGELIVEGDACLSGVVEVGTFTSPISIVSLPFDIITPSFPGIWPEELIPARYFPKQPVLFDLITVDGICDWSEATLILPSDEMNRYIIHEHGLRVLKTPPPGDANGDGLVNDIDATLLAANWHANGATWGMGDFDLDGDVDGDDMVILAGNWQYQYDNLYPWYYHGEYPPLDMSQVPEPSIALLVLTGISILALHKRRRYKRCNDIRWAGFSCGLKKQGLFALIIAASILLASSALADEFDPWESLGAEGSISDFSGVIAGSGDHYNATIVLDGSKLTWSDMWQFRTLGIEDLYAVDPDQGGYKYESVLCCRNLLSVRNGGELNAYTVRISSAFSIEGMGSVANVLSGLAFRFNGAVVNISNGGVLNCDRICMKEPPGCVAICVDGSGSSLNVKTINDFSLCRSAPDISLRNGGTINCDSLMGRNISIDGAGSRMNVQVAYMFGDNPFEGLFTSGIQVTNGGSFYVESEHYMQADSVLDVTDGGYAQIGGDTSLPRIAGTVRVAEGGLLNFNGDVLGSVLVEKGGAIGQWKPQIEYNDMQEFSINHEYPKDHYINEFGSLELQEGGRYATNMDLRRIGHMEALGFGEWERYSRIRIKSDADLHGTFKIGLLDDTLPVFGEQIPLIAVAGSSDVTGLHIEFEPWLESTPVITNEGVSAVTELAGDGVAGIKEGPGKYLSGMIAFSAEEQAGVNVDAEQISWTDGCHLVIDSEERPGRLFVGYHGEATLKITDRTIENRSAYIGSHINGSGKVDIEGPDAKWHFSECEQQANGLPREDASVLVIGNRGGRGEVNVREGASLEITEGTIKIGGDYSYREYGQDISPVPVPHGSKLSITGAGSTVKAANLDFGAFGCFELLIESGGKLTCGSINKTFSAQNAEDAITRIEIDGVGSALECEADFEFSHRMDFSINITRGGRFSTKNAFDLIVYDSLPHYGCFSDEKNIAIEGSGSIWLNEGQFSLHPNATMKVLNGGKIVTGSFLIDGSRVQVENVGRMIVNEKLFARHGEIDLRNGGAINIGEAILDEIPEGVLRVGKGGELSGNATINADLIIESGGLVTCSRYRSYQYATLKVDSIDLKPGGTLRILDCINEPEQGKVTVEGDARLAGIVEVGSSFLWPYAEKTVVELYFPQKPILLDLITVGGVFDWSEATLILPSDEMNRYIMHEHGLRVLKTPPPGDANGDGLVNDIDATLLAANWHANGATWGMGDFDLDGDVDGEDMVILAGNWQKAFENLHPWHYNGEYPPLDMSQVPEPSSALLVLTGVFAFVFFKRWRRKV